MTDKNLEYWKNNAEENYRRTPISVLRYIRQLEQRLESGQHETIDALIGIKPHLIELKNALYDDGLTGIALLLSNQISIINEALKKAGCKETGEL